MYLYCTVLSGRTVLYRLSRNSSSGHIFEEHVFTFPKKREISAATDLNVHSSGNVFCVLPDTLFIRLTPPTIMTPYALAFFSGDVPIWSWVRFPLLYFYDFFFFTVFLHFLLQYFCTYWFNMRRYSVCILNQYVQ